MKLTATLTFQIDNARKTPETDSHYISPGGDG